MRSAIVLLVFCTGSIVFAQSSDGCQRNISFAWAGQGTIILAMPSFAPKWIEKNQAKFPGVSAFLSCRIPTRENFLILFSATRESLMGIEPVLRTYTSTSTTPVSGAGTLTDSSGSHWQYTYYGTATTITDTTVQENRPYTVNSKTIYMSAYDDFGIPVATHWRTTSQKQGGNPNATLGYNIAEIITSYHYEERLLNEMVNEIAASKVAVEPTKAQPPVSMNAQESRFDGTLWSTGSREIKIMYVSGFSDGLADGIAKTALLLGSDTSSPKLGKAQPPKVTLGQIVEGMDAFYRDWRNQRILMSGAIDYVMHQARGEEQTEFLKWLREHPDLH